jgi:hypothetical protein
MRRSFILISVVLTSALLLAAVTALLGTGTAERQIASSQFSSVVGYNLAEGAVQHAVWRLKNDATWSSQFISNASWSASITRSNVFGTGASYSLSVQNTSLAHATIIATSTWPIAGGATAQRVVKVKAFKALAITPEPNQAVLSDTNFTAQFGAVVNVAVGSLHANDDIDISWLSNVQVQATTSAQGTIDTSCCWIFPGTLSTPVRRAANYPPAPAEIDIPAVDFDSAQATSFKSRAAAQGFGHVTTTAGLTNTLYRNANLVLNGIYYVTGDVNLVRGRHLTVNGTLVADGQINIGVANSSTSAWTELRVNNTSGLPSGLISKSSINLGLFTNVFTVTGVIYALDRFQMLQILQTPSITGAIFARDIDFNGILSPTTITHSQTIVDNSLGVPQYSPVISVEHWEEEY